MRKLQKAFAMLLTVCMVMSLLSVTAFAEESEGSTGFYDCGKEAHTHGEDCYTKTLDCEKEWDLACGGHTEHTDDCYTAHKHDEDCYEVSTEMTCTSDHVHTEECYKEVRELVCEESTETVLVCEEELHVHSEEGGNCYLPHKHVEDCYAYPLTCDTEVHVHEFGCLAPDAEAEVKGVEELIAAIPTTAEMDEAAKAANNTISNNIYESLMASVYEKAYEAKSAYEKLDGELQALVRNVDVLESLTELLGLELPVFEAETENLSAGEEPYVFGLSSQYYQITPIRGRVNQAMLTFIMADTSKYTGSWSPDDIYEPGVSNYDVTYCCDLDTEAEDFTYYKRTNLEEAEYFEDDIAKKLRAVATHAYPFISAYEMRNDLKDWFAENGYADIDVNAIDESQMTAATQLTVWSYANSDWPAENWICNTNKRRSVSSAVYTTPSLYNPHSGSYRPGYPEMAARVDAVVAYLRSLEPMAAEPDEIVINQITVQEMLPVAEKNGIYTAALKVKLNGSGSSKADNIKITAKSTIDEAVVDVVLADTEYVLALDVMAGEEVTVTVSGTQNLPKSAYFYQPKATENTTAQKVSQNMIGVAMGDTPIQAMSKQILVSKDETITGSAGLTVKKVNDSGEPLTGAEFTLHYVYGDDTAEMKTYAVDENGVLTISGLLPGKTYELTETKAPEGYEALDEAIEFTVSADGTTINTVNLPDDVRCETEDDEYILTVVNCPEPEHNNGGGGGSTPNPDPEELPDPEVPLTPSPEVSEEEDVLEEIEDPEVPLATVPKTGDMSALWLALTALSGTGLAGVTFCKKREEEQ